MKKQASYEIKVGQLTDLQKAHLAWRLDHKTYCGMISAIRIAKGKYLFNLKPSANCTLFEIFKAMELTDHAAKIHARKVIDYPNTPKGIKASKL